MRIQRFNMVHYNTDGIVVQHAALYTPIIDNDRINAHKTGYNQSLVNLWAFSCLFLVLWFQSELRTPGNIRYTCRARVRKPQFPTACASSLLSLC